MRKAVKNNLIRKILISIIILSVILLIFNYISKTEKNSEEAIPKATETNLDNILMLKPAPDSLKATTEELLFLHFNSSIAINYDEYKLKKGKRNSRKQILDAVNQTVKFFLFNLEESISSPGRIRGAVSLYYPIIVTFLVIVLDGKLFDARIENNNGSYVLDLSRAPVKKEFFSSYLSKINQDISIISDKIIFEREILSTYLKKDPIEDAHENIPEL